MNLIAVETSAEACSAALWYSGQVVERFALAPRGHSELILPMLDEVLAEGGVSRSSIDALAFGRGPGSFTGVRIAAGVIQGIAYALDRPVVPVSSLLALAQGVMRSQGKRRVLTAFDARMGEVYWAPCEAEKGQMRLTGEEVVCPPASVPLPAGDGWCGAGSGWRSYDGELSAVIGGQLETRLPDAQCHALDVAVIAAEGFAAGEAVDAAQALPVYLRDRVAWKKA